ncbi:50S ribosomal protein L25 [bacterium]|nr:50S ribosomal protein L25 [bacterium]
MAEADLHVEYREKTGHYIAKSIRRSGKVPAIFYAHGKDTVPLIVNEKELSRLLHSEVNVLNVIFPDGKKEKSILREVQRDVVTDKAIHVDIMGIKLTEKIRISIPVVLTGNPIGVKEGGILEHLLREVEVEGLPLEIPEHIEVDVSGLKIGDVIKLEDISVDKIKFITDIHHALANVIHPKVLVEEVVEEEKEEIEAEAEEITKEGKEEKEEKEEEKAEPQKK